MKALWHIQDLNESHRHLFYKRGWLSFWDDQGEGRMLGGLKCSWELSVPSPFLHIGLTFGGEDAAIGVSIALFFFAWWFSIENVLPRRWVGWDAWPHETKVAWHDGCLWLHVHAGIDDQPLVVHVVDLLLGRPHYAKHVLASQEATVYIEDDDTFYDCTVELSECTWTRSRWPKVLRVQRAEVQFVTPIPIPGKGENAWDCDEDGIYTSTFPCASITEALDHVKQGALQTRRKYGGAGWRPKGAAV